jgi:hypothetical protein
MDKLTRTAPKWNVPLQDQIVKDLDKEALEKHRAVGREKIDLHAKELHEAGLLERVRDTDQSVTTSSRSRPTNNRKWTYDPLYDEFYRIWEGVAQCQPARWKMNQKRLRSNLAGAAQELGLKDYPVSEKTKKISTKSDYWNLYKHDLSDGLQAWLDYSKETTMDKLTRTAPKWNVPLQDQIVKDLDKDGWCLVDVRDPSGGPRLLIFRKKGLR